MVAEELMCSRDYCLLYDYRSKISVRLHLCVKDCEREGLVVVTFHKNESSIALHTYRDELK